MPVLTPAACDLRGSVSFTHVDNICHGLILAAEELGKPDGE